MFKNVIVRRPARSLVDGLTLSPELGKPDYDQALRQHDAYMEALASCGVSVTALDAIEEYPDSCFVEDVAVCTPKCAVLTNPGAPSRKGEIQGIIDALSEHYPQRKLERIQDPGTLEGGDVMMVGGHYYIGLSARTNPEGADQLIAILKKHGLSGSTVPVTKILHRKTGMSYMENDNLLITGEFVENPAFKDFNRLVVPQAEAYAANCIWMNGTVIVPAEYPGVKKTLEDLGYPTVIVDTSEFRKIDGGLTCLSLRF